MTASEVHVVRRERPSLIAILRVVLPAIAAATFLAVVVAASLSAIRTAERRAAAALPVELVAPRLVGEDSKGRPFVITADTAQRENDTNRIQLKAPVLLRNQGGEDEMRVTAVRGTYDEATGRLELAENVKMQGEAGVFSTQGAVYDAKSGEIIGSGSVKAVGDAVEVEAGSFVAKDKGKSVVYKGGVHTRLNVK